MIKVNLLPQEAAPRGAAAAGAGAPGASAIIALILVAAYVLVILVGAGVWYKNDQSRQALLTAQRERDKVKADIASIENSFKEIKRNKELFQNQLGLLNTLDPPSRLLWCEKINLLPQLVPDGVFLTRVKVDEQITEVETPESVSRRRDWEQSKAKNKGAKPTVIKKPVIYQTLILEGVAYIEGGQSDRRLDLVATFLRNFKEKEVVVPHTKKTKSFMENFEGDVLFDPIVGDRIEGREVSKFVFRIRSRPM